MPKKIIICCDGTWNEPESIMDDHITNVLKLMRALKPVDGNEKQQVAFYDPGVGTGGLWDKYVGGTTGWGISENIQDAYRFLVNNYGSGDEIYCFGFSRGAYTVRSLSGFISLVGLLEKSDMKYLPQAYAYYRTPPEKRQKSKYHKLIADLIKNESEIRNPENITIRFMGVWDTVGALGAPTPFLGYITKKLWVKFHDTRLEKQIEYAYQALAVDEKRGPFKPAIWEKNNGQKEVLQVWFPGVHSNIGGGYRDHGLSDLAFRWMVTRAEHCGLEFSRSYLEREVEPADRAYKGKVMNSYSKVYELLEKFKVLMPLFKPTFVRPVGVTGVNEKIHEDAVKRMEEDEGYQPENLKEAIEKGVPVFKENGAQA